MPKKFISYCFDALVMIDRLLLMRNYFKYFDSMRERSKLCTMIKSIIVVFALITTFVCGSIANGLATTTDSNNSGTNDGGDASGVSGILKRVWCLFNSIGTPIIVIVIAGVGVLFLLGKVNWVLVLTTVSGLVIAKSAPTIITYLVGEASSTALKCGDDNDKINNGGTTPTS